MISEHSPTPLPSVSGRPDHGKPSGARQLRRDLKTLTRFVELHCRNRHRQAEKAPAQLKGYQTDQMAAQAVLLCADCRKLLAHALVRRTRCPMNPKPACKHCPSHCYHPRYREAIQEAMKYSGPRLILSGRLHYLFHLLF